MKTMSMEDVRERVSCLSQNAQNQVLKLFERKMSGLPIIAGAYKTRTQWWGSRIKDVVRIILNLAEAMAERRGVNINSIDLSTFEGEDVAAYMNLRPKENAAGWHRNDTLLWTQQICKTLRTLIASIAIDLPRNSEQRINLEEWVAYPPKYNIPTKRPDPVLDDRVHPGLAIRKGIDYIQHTGQRNKRHMKIVEFIFHSLLGIRPGEEMAPENFKLDEFNIDPNTGLFRSKEGEPDLLAKRYHKQNRTPSYYQGIRPYLTVVVPAAKEFLEPWFVKRIREGGASLSDPVLPNYTLHTEDAYYIFHQKNLAAAMGLYSWKGLRPYSGRKLHNRCLRLLPTTEMQAILNRLALHVNVTDDYVKCMVYIAMRQSLRYIVDFNWENYDTLVGVGGHTACVIRAMELALRYDMATEVHAVPLIAQDAPVTPVSHEKTEALRTRMGQIRAALQGSLKLTGRERFQLMAEKYQTEHLLTSYGVELNG